MDKIPYRIPEYHKMVWVEARNLTNRYFLADKRNSFYGVVSAIFSGFVVPYLLQKLGGVTMPNFWLQLFIVVLSTLFGFALIILIDFVSNGIYRVPAMFYRERETEAWGKTWNDIEVKLFRFPDTFVNGVGLEMISDKNRKVHNGGISEEFYIEVENVIIEEFSHGTVTLNPKRELYMYATDLTKFNETNSIQNRRQARIKENWIKQVVLLVAQWNNEMAWITTKDNVKDLVLERGVPYRVIINFTKCRIGLSNFENWGCAVWLNLRYVENAHGAMKVEIDIVNRNPEYAYKKN